MISTKSQLCALRLRVRSTGQPKRASISPLASAVMAWMVLPAGPMAIDCRGKEEVRELEEGKC